MTDPELLPLLSRAVQTGYYRTILAIDTCTYRSLAHLVNIIIMLTTLGTIIVTSCPWLLIATMAPPPAWCMSTWRMAAWLTASRERYKNYQNTFID